MSQANSRAVRKVPVMARRKGFKAELDGLRERMRVLEFGTDEIATEVARRFRARPREAYRLAWGWSLGQAAAWFNDRAAVQDADPKACAGQRGRLGGRGHHHSHDLTVPRHSGTVGRGTQAKDAIMDGTTGTGRRHASGNPRRAARPALPDQHRPLASVADVTQAAPFAARWPLRSFLEFGALPGAVPCARLHARQVLWEWGLAECSDSTELLVSELVTNAMQISRGTGQDDPVRLWLVSDGRQVVIFVWDASPLPPVPADAGQDAESGRGLLIVEAVSQRWGWDFPPALGGKVVWAQTSTE